MCRRSRTREFCLVYPRPSSSVVGDVGARISSWFPTGTVLLDIEPLLMPWGATGGFMELSRALTPVPLSVRNRIVLVSNSGKYSGSHNLRVVSCALKPLTSTRILRRFYDPVAVVGDTYVTDGLLAERLGIPFVEIVFRGLDPPLMGRIEKLCGTSIRMLLKNEINVQRTVKSINCPGLGA